MKIILRYLWITGLVAAVLLIAASCVGSTATPAKGGAPTSPPPGQTTGPDYKPAAVSIADYKYAPDVITVPVGTTVTWTNTDAMRHTVTADDGAAFDSGLFGQNETFSFTFNTPGEYPYHCTPHPYMKGKVVVQ